MPRTTKPKLPVADTAPPRPRLGQPIRPKVNDPGHSSSDARVMAATALSCGLTPPTAATLPAEFSQHLTRSAPEVPPPAYLKLGELPQPLHGEHRRFILGDLPGATKDGTLRVVPRHGQPISVSISYQGMKLHSKPYVDLLIENSERCQNWLDTRAAEWFDWMCIHYGVSEQVEAEMVADPERFARLAKLFQQQRPSASRHVEKGAESE
jgi:hypothetical protein